MDSVGSRLDCAARKLAAIHRLSCSAAAGRRVNALSLRHFCVGYSLVQ